METRHPVEGYLNSELWAICNHCGVITAWRRKTLKFVEEFCVFWKTTPYGKILKILYREFLPLLFSNFVKFVWWEIGEIVRYLPDKKYKNSPAFQTVATARIALKICQCQPPAMFSECSRFHPNRLNFSGFIAERVNTAKLPRRVNSILGGSLASSRIITTMSDILMKSSTTDDRTFRILFYCGYNSFWSSDVNTHDGVNYLRHEVSW